MENKFDKIYNALSVLDDENRFKHENLKIEDARNLISEAKKISDGYQEIIKDGKVLKIGIVGQVKAGKSSFLNALFFNGNEVLPKASTPMTAGLTVIRYAESPSFEIEFYTQEDFKVFEDNASIYEKKFDEKKRQYPEWTIKDIEADLSQELGDEVCSSKEIVDRCKMDARKKIGSNSEKIAFNDIDEMQGKLIDYVGADGNYTSVTKSLFLYLNDERLKEMEIVDTPGVNDPVVSREERTREFLRTCHGVFLLSYAGQLCSTTDIDFLENRINNQGIDAVVLLASKYDSALQEIGFKIPDLERAHNKLERDLRQNFENALKNTGYKGVKPKFDVASGICYSLYLKEKHSWDDMEKHVFKNLSELFPDFFTPEDYKDTLLGLSNIETIREEYIEKEFKNNKEKIITTKLNNYVSKNKSNIQAEIEIVKKNAVNQKKLIENSDLEKLKEDRDAYKKVFTKIQGGISGTIRDAKQNLNAVGHNLTQVTWDIPLSLSKNKYTFNFKIDSGYWLVPNKKGSVTYMELDREEIKNRFSTSGNEYIENVSKHWSDQFKKGGKFEENLKLNIQKKIEESLETQPKLDPEILHNALSEVLSNITSIRIDFKKLKEDFEMDIIKLKFPKRLTEAYYPNGYTFNKNATENGVKISINNKTEELENEMIQTLFTQRTLVESSAKRVFDSSLQTIENELTKLNTSLVSTLEKEFNMQLNILEKDIKEKEVVIPIFDDYIQTVDSALVLIKQFRDE